MSPVDFLADFPRRRTSASSISSRTSPSCCSAIGGHSAQVSAPAPSCHNHATLADKALYGCWEGICLKEVNDCVKTDFVPATTFNFDCRPISKLASGSFRKDSNTTDTLPSSPRHSEKWRIRTKYSMTLDSHLL
eukprot:757543-Hanusia_phi.AAC.2